MQLTKEQARTLEGAALVVGANLLSRGLTKMVVGDKDGDKDQDKEIQENYDKLDKPIWSAPSWLFGPAWLSINACQAYGTTKLLNERRSTERTTALAAHTLAWALFVSWSPGSLALKSQKRSAALTFLTAAAAGACVYFGARVNKKVGMAYLPMAIWGLYASAQSAWIAKNN